MSTVAPTRFDEMCARALDDPEGFWGEVAADLPWFRRWDRVYEADPPSFRWFVGGRTNIAWNALDAHVRDGHGDRTALIAIDERGGDRRLTYRELLAEVERVAAALRAQGIRRGDRLTVYLPTIAEAVVSLLAIVRIGAIHSVVFAGFGHGALADRIVASGSRLVLTSDITYRKGNDVNLLSIVRDAVAAANAQSPGLVERVIVLRRADPAPELRAGELDWADFLASGDGPFRRATRRWTPTSPRTSSRRPGTTAKPKLAVHVHGGYQVHIVAMGRWVFGLRREDIFWATADIGWAVGHAYTVYAPLIVGATTVAYEGALDYPTQRRGVGAHGPTRDDRHLHVADRGPAAHALRRGRRASSTTCRRVERVVCAGEVLNPPAWEWLQKTVFDDRIPVIDNMWQTETGGPIFGNPYGIELMPIKPGSAGPAAAGHRGGDRQPGRDRSCRANEKGIMVIRRPFPGLTPTLWGEPERYATDYWSRIPGSYWVGDAAHIDDDGYAFFAGRADEIIKIASHRLGTIEVETAFLRHPAVAEAGATGRPDDLRGEVIAAFIVLKAGREPSDELAAELRQTLRNELGALAVLGELTFVDMLPKTRSGQDHAPRPEGRRGGPRSRRHHDDRGRGLGRGGTRGRRRAAGVDARPDGDRAALDAARVGREPWRTASRPAGRSSSTPTGRSSILPRWPSRSSDGSRDGARRSRRPGVRRQLRHTWLRSLMGRWADFDAITARGAGADARRRRSRDRPSADRRAARGLPFPAAIPRRRGRAGAARRPTGRAPSSRTVRRPRSRRRSPPQASAPRSRSSCRPRTPACTSPRRASTRWSRRPSA